MHGRLQFADELLLWRMLQLPPPTYQGEEPMVDSGQDVRTSVSWAAAPDGFMGSGGRQQFRRGGS